MSESMQKFSTTKKVVPIDQVVPNKFNPNIQTKQMFEKGVNSVKEFGMLGSILVRELAGMYEIVDGEHRWKYAKELGYKEITIESLGEISEDKLKVLTILLNNLKGKDDIEKRVAIYESLSAGQLQLLPFTEEEIENEKKLFKFDFAQYENQTEVVPSDSLTKVISFKLTEDEWTVVQKALEIAKSENENQKQWFMGMLQHYLQVRLGSSVGQTAVTF